MIGATGGPATGVPPAQLIGQTVRGWLKKYQEGWGFMNSDAFIGDLFVHARENPEIVKFSTPMTEFYFSVAQDSKGKPMATNATAANPAQPQAAAPQTTIQSGERLVGLVRTFADHWGFIRTDNGQDFYFHERSIETYGGDLPTVGSRVEFSTAPDNQKPDKVMAVSLKILTPGTGAVPGMEPSRKRAYPGGTPTRTIEEIEAGAFMLPSVRLFQLAEFKMRQEMPAGAGTLQGQGLG
jgi:cold shock CspA family protein